MNRHKKTSLVSNIIKVLDSYPRELYVILFFIVFFFAIIFETFSYTVINYDFYSNLANKQQTGEAEIPVTRGSIYTAKSNTMNDGTIYSTSVDLMDLAIDPQIDGDIRKLEDFLTDLLYNEMCYLKTNEDCYNDILRFTKQLKIVGFSFSQDYVLGIIRERVKELLSQKYVTSVKLRDAISPDDERAILSWGIQGVYPNENGLYVNPMEITNTGSFVSSYTALFGGEEDAIAYSIRQREKRYVPIFSKLSLSSSDKIENHIEEESMRVKQGIEEKEETIGGFIIMTPHAQRIYPERETGSQITGFIDNSGKGHYGLEGYFDEELRGNPGELIMKKDVRGRPIDPSTFGETSSKTFEGVNIYTTIDRNVQNMVEKVLEEGVKKYRANKGTIVVMQPDTGKVLSMANYPSFDANNPGDVYDLKKVTGAEYPNPTTDLLGKTVLVEDIERGDPYLYNGDQIYLREAEREEYGIKEIDKYIYVNEFGAGVYRNDAISSLYEPGSIMKSITVAVGIDSGEIQPYDMYNDVGEVTIDNFTISNVDDECLGYHSFTHALGYSCNVGMIRIVQRVGKAIMHKYLHDFGFGNTTDISLQGETYSKISPYERWPVSQLLTTSYGLGISVTPLQMALAYSALANGGVLMKPYIVEKIVDSEGNVTNYAPQTVRRVLKESTSKSMTNMLVESVESGVAGNAKVEGYSVAGKTGTSQIAYKGKYEKGEASTYASFAGYAPAEDPEFVIIIKLERPRTTIYGGASSAYMFSELSSKLLDYYAIPKKVQNNID